MRNSEAHIGENSYSKGMWHHSFFFWKSSTVFFSVHSLFTQTRVGIRDVTRNATKRGQHDWLKQKMWRKYHLCRLCQNVCHVYHGLFPAEIHVKKLEPFVPMVSRFVLPLLDRCALGRHVFTCPVDRLFLLAIGFSRASHPVASSRSRHPVEDSIPWRETLLHLKSQTRRYYNQNKPNQNTFAQFWQYFWKIRFGANIFEIS